ncbi:MAG: DUF3391 domain-containing protein [Novosphingobium sp.]|nr:DUF3391 domain-containing protein [Novosphingobium sp.]
MLKKISVADVELGMFIHKLEGNWFKHPFWKSRFLLEDPQTLSSLQMSDVPAVVIDTTRGYDVRPLPHRAKSAAPPPAGPALRARIARDSRPAPGLAASGASPTGLRSTAPLGMAREFGNARQVERNSRKMISRVFLEARLGKTFDSSQVEPVVEDIFASIQRNPHAFNGLMRCRNENEYTFRHALAVSALMVSLGRQMKLGPQQIREAGLVGLLMDVGAGLLPVDLSQMGGDFRRVDPAILRQHVQLGHDFLEAAGDIPDEVLRACREHHERIDGAGYPAGLCGEEISLLARMAAICDAYDELVADGIDQRGSDPAWALRHMGEDAGRFDQEILQRFIDAMGVYPIGSFVRLRSERLAMVIDEDAADYSRPKVRTFYSLRLDKRIKSETIALARCYGEDEIVGLADLAGIELAELRKLRESLFQAACKSDT